jgi:RimJ/RimL family protein N-acetyltransferase
MQLAQEIQTKRLLLRPPTEADAENIFTRYGQDALVCKYMSWTPHRTLNDTLDFLRRLVDENARGASTGYLVFSRETNQLLGSVGGAKQNQRVQFGYCLARDAWGHGYATEAAGAFVDAVMAEPEIWRIQAFCDLENRASARVLQKIGLAHEGTLRRYLVLPNLGDTPRDVHCFAKVKA